MVYLENCLWLRFLYHVEATLKSGELSSQSHTFSGRRVARHNAKQERVAKIMYTA